MCKNLQIFVTHLEIKCKKLHIFFTLETKNAHFTGRKEVLSIFDKKDYFSDKITLFLPEQLTKNSNISNYAIATFCVLQALSIPTQMEMQCITNEQLVYYLTGKVPESRNRIYDYIKCGLNELIDNNFITKVERTNKYYILDCSDLWIDTEKEKFTIISFEEVKQIFKIQGINHFWLLKYFILLISTISNKITVYLENGDYKNRVVGNYTIEYLAKVADISERSAIEYNSVLEEAGLIYICRPEDFVIDDDNNITRLNNAYGRPCDSEYVDKFVMSQEKRNESYRYTQNNISKANNKRRLAQMYQQLKKGEGKHYTNGEILDIYNYVISENEKYYRMCEKNQYEGYLNKIRDIEIFKKYDFIKEK